MKFWVILATLTTAVTLRAQTGTTPFASDSRLKQTITMREKIVSLADFAADLQKLTKIPFSAAGDIADRKITAIFNDRAVTDVMDAVQNAMFFEWKKVGNGYRLILPISEYREEKALVDAEDEALRQDLLKELRLLARIPDLSPDDVDRKTKELRASLATLRNDPSPNAVAKANEISEQVRMLHADSAVGIAKAVSGNLPAVVNELMAGKTICASTRPADSIPKLPAGYMDHLMARNPQSGAAVALMRYDSMTQILQSESCIASNNPRQGNRVTEFFHYQPDLGSEPDLKSSRLMTRLRKWQDEGDPMVMDKLVSTNGPAEAPPGYTALGGVPGFTLAEHLEYLADHANVPVIGDAFRIFCSPAVFGTDTTVRSYVARLRKSKHMRQSVAAGPVGYFTSRNGWLFVRHSKFWRRLVVEIPESALRPLESIARTKDFPSTSDYASFVAKLTPEQGDEINTLDGAFRFDNRPVRMAQASLRLWATLSPEQKSAAAQEAGLNLVELTPAQATIVLDGWAKQMWQGRLPASIWASFFSSHGLVGTTPVLRYQYFDLATIKKEVEGTVGGRPRDLFPREQATFVYDITPEVSLSDLYIVEKTLGRGIE